MAHYGLLRNYRFEESTDDIRGASLYGRDNEKLGKIDDVIFDHSSGTIRYVVVDTGGWLRSKKFIVPAERLRASGEQRNDFTSDLTKEQVESFPAYNENDLESEERWGDYETRYRAKWEKGPVMHRAETDRNITPTTQQLQGNQSSMRAEGYAGSRVAGTGSGTPEDVRAADVPTGRVVSAGTDSVVIDNGAVGIGGRWDTFQSRLRERRKEAVVGCTTCTVGPAGTKGSESADTFKKAI
jgi:sporulation protein YlmC with PRC-barrel domain